MEPNGVVTWERFTELFLEKYFPRYMETQMELKFLELKQDNMTVAEYEAKFTELSRFVPEFVSTDAKKARRFQQGLKQWIDQERYQDFNPYQQFNAYEDSNAYQVNSFDCYNSYYAPYPPSNNFSCAFENQYHDRSTRNRKAK
ncbi:retrotransposon gag family protein [Klebsiella pneumoniae]